jgi:transcriptional regulator with XRE-family HTH domain
MRRPKEDRSGMSPEEKTFFEELGKRIATLRQGRGLTQVQLAEILDVSQQHLLSFEKGRRRVPASALPALAKTLGVSVEVLLGAEAPPTKRGPTPKLQKQLEQLSQLPRSKQRFVTEMLDTVLQQSTQ